MRYILKHNLLFIKNFREDKQVIGAYFIIDHVGTQDIGQYVCSVANADSVIEIPVSLHQKGSFIKTINKLYIIDRFTICSNYNFQHLKFLNDMYRFHGKVYYC